MILSKKEMFSEPGAGVGMCLASEFSAARQDVGGGALIIRDESRMSPANRHCANEGCGKKLSRYNPDDECNACIEAGREVFVAACESVANQEMRKREREEDRSHPFWTQFVA